MKKVYSLSEAAKFFLENSSGACICVKGVIEKECNCYPDAAQFYLSP